MSLILVDTNVLIALVDSTDHLHGRASEDLIKRARGDLRVTSAVLSECAFGLPREDQRGRLSLLLERLPIVPVAPMDETALRRAIFDWLARYADHTPDYADGELCVLAAMYKRSRVWTYDSEFKKVWRKPDGRRVSLLGQ